MLRKKTNGVARRPRTESILSNIADKSVDRRSFLRGSGLAIGGLAALGAVGGTVRKAEAAQGEGKVDIIKSVCTHCSVGCTVLAEVQNGVWTGQEPGWDSPFNLGAHCAKGAAVREHAHGERRLKYPMKLSGGEWQKMSWEDAINVATVLVVHFRRDRQFLRPFRWRAMGCAGPCDPTRCRSSGCGYRAHGHGRCMG